MSLTGHNQVRLVRLGSIRFDLKMVGSKMASIKLDRVRLVRKMNAIELYHTNFRD